jgi:cytochrome b6-f complex iron-sulfur subunit
MNRRELIRNVAAGTATLFIVPTVITSCEEDLPDPDNNDNPDDKNLIIDLDESKYEALLTTGNYLVVSDIIIMNRGDSFLALSSKCTHNNCTVSYDHSKSNLPCPCHGSVFSTTGDVLNGPAETALKKYTLSRDGNILTIVL